MSEVFGLRCCLVIYFSHFCSDLRDFTQKREGSVYSFFVCDFFAMFFSCFYYTNDHIYTKAADEYLSKK